MNFTKKEITNFILIFVLGGIGGVFFSDILLPKFSIFSGITQKGEQTVIVQKTEKVSVEEQEILSNIIKKNSESLVVIKNLKNNSFVSSGAGFIVSSDGLILTRREVVPSDDADISIERGNEKFTAKVYKRMDDNGLVLLKSEASNLPVVTFANPADISLGNKVILIGNKTNSLGNREFINVGFLKSIDGSTLETSLQEDSNLASGTPLFDLKGNVIGINFTNSKGYVFSISSEIIQSFVE